MSCSLACIWRRNQVFWLGVFSNKRRINADIAQQMHLRVSIKPLSTPFPCFTLYKVHGNRFCACCILPKYSSACSLSFAHPQQRSRALQSLIVGIVSASFCFLSTVSVHCRWRLKFEEETIPGWDLSLKIPLLMDLPMMQQALIHPNICGNRALVLPQSTSPTNTIQASCR